MSEEPVVAEEIEELASVLFDEIMLVCSVLLQVDQKGGNAAFGINETYQEAIRLAQKWVGKGESDGNGNDSNTGEEKEVTG